MNGEGVTRSAKCFRSTGISMLLEYSKNPDYNIIAKMSRTSPALLYAWYDQNHPRKSIERVAAFREPKKKSSQHAVGIDDDAGVR